jgi:hypothetical protein
MRAGSMSDAYESPLVLQARGQALDAAFSARMTA